MSISASVQDNPTTQSDSSVRAVSPPVSLPEQTGTRPREIGGPSGPEPTRYGDWEKKGRCIDF